MFEVANKRSTPIKISFFDQIFWNAYNGVSVEVYTLNGSCGGKETIAAAWTQVGSATIATKAQPTLTKLPVPIGINIKPGAVQSFYITATSDAYNTAPVAYTRGNNQYGTVYASNADIALVARAALDYPFAYAYGLGDDGLGNNGRLWSGAVQYCT